jgi:putative ABC transport system permease protein
MRFLPLVWCGIWRKPGRTILIFLQVAVAFALFGVLQGLKSGVEALIANARADLLIVHSRASSIAEGLPLGLNDQIRSVPGVKVVIPVDLTGAIYQKPAQRLLVVAVRPDENWQDAFTFQLSPQADAAFRKTRTGALMMPELAQKYGWKVGDRIPLKFNTLQQNGSADWTFDIVGIFTDSDLGGGGGQKILINYAYFDEARATGRGTVNHFNAAVTDAQRAAAVSDAIDRRFANSAHETLSESLRELAEQEMQAIGDLNFLIRAVVGAVLVALLFATATMMMQSIRERTPELAVLKTVGFSNRAVFALVLAEALIVCIAGAAFGLALANVVFPYAARLVPGLSMPWLVVVSGLGAAVLVALCSAALPALRAARLTVVAALAER